jgi:type I restriction enzyme S subunit
VGAVAYTGIIRFRPVDDRISRGFVSHLLASPSFKVQIEAMGVGSVMRHFGPSHLRKMTVDFPPLETQYAISEVLGALDDKIAGNERIGTTVDALVSTLYEGALERGEACCLLLGAIADVNKSVMKPKVDGTLRYVDIASVAVGSYEFPELTPWADAPGRARRKAAVGDTIWSTVRPNRRSHALVLDDDPELVFSTGLAVLSPTAVGPALLYEVTHTSEFQAYLESVAEGSAYPAVRADRFKQAPVSLPATDECEKFEAAAMQLRLRAHQAAVESRTLAALRDTLLPQLMSGKLRVRDAERIVEDAV